MAHYKQNNNSNFIPQKNVKKKKKLTTSQLIVFILMCFWTICSIIGCFGFGLSVAKAEETTKNSSNTPSYTDFSFGDVSNLGFNNLLYLEPLANSCFVITGQDENPNITFSRANGYLSDWYYPPFDMVAGTYTFSIANFSGNPNYPQFSVQMLDSKGTNYYARFYNNSGSSMSFLTSSIAVTSTITRLRFVMASSYPLSTTFTFSNPSLHYGNFSTIHFAPCFLNFTTYTADNGYYKGYDDGVSYGFSDGYADGYRAGELAYLNKYGTGDLGALMSANFSAILMDANQGNRVAISDIKGTQIGQNGLDFSSLWDNVLPNGEKPTYIEFRIDFEEPFIYSESPLFTFNYPSQTYDFFLDTPSYEDPILFTGKTSVENIDTFETVFFENNYQIRSSTFSSGYVTSYLPDIEVDGVKTLFYNKKLISFFSYDFLRMATYNLGYDDGKLAGIEEATTTDYFLNAMYEARDKGYTVGYNKGVEDAKKQGVGEYSYSFTGLMGAVIDAPLNAVINMFDFDILGFNMKSFYLSLITVSLIVFIVKRFI